LFEGIRSLPAASFVEVSLDSPSTRGPVSRFWDLSIQEARPIPYADAVSELRERFLQNVELHLRSDVPVATALSGGIDSSSIVMAMRRLEPTQDIRTFSWIADDPAIDEERWVDVVVDAASVEGRKVRASPAEFVADLDRLIEVQGEPFGSTSIYAQYRVFSLAASAGVKVMLDGQGADEALAGYRGYLGTRLASLVAGGHFTTAARLARNFMRLPGVGGRSLALATANGVVPAAAQRGARRLAGEALMPEWLNEDWFQRRGVSGRAPAWPRSGSDRLREKLRADLLSDSLPALLRYEDRNSMAFSIESRVPFLTPDLMTFVLSLPESYLLGDDGTTKRVLRDAMRGIVPDVILDRRDKIGFATPEHGWLASLQPWVDTTLKSDAARQVVALRLDKVSAHWQAVLNGERPFDWRIWRWLNLVRWSELVGADFS
jgi:asparagine synthase (glutamine-hydrolysing)